MAQESQWVWEPVGVGGVVGEFCIFDDGSGRALYAVGSFSSIAGVNARCIAKFDGKVWAPVGGGIDGVVVSMVVHDDGSGPALYCGGVIHSAGGVPIKNVARWDGEAWSAVGDGIKGEDIGVSSLVSVPGPQGATLYAAGVIGFAGGHYVDGIVKLSGNHWEGIPGTGGSIYALTVFDDGDGPALFAGGQFEKIGGEKIRDFARWDGAAWSDPGAAFDYLGYIAAMLPRIEGGRTALYLGGGHDWAGDLAIYGICRWDGQAWSALGTGVQPSDCSSLASYPCPISELLVAGGDFVQAGGAPASGIAAWDGLSWSPIGSGVQNGYGVTYADPLAVFDSGNGPVLFVAGNFQEAGGLYSPNLAKVRFIPNCTADCDGSGTLDLFDFLCFVNRFNAKDPGADCDASGSLDLFDFLCFVNAFNAGCP